VTSARNEKIRVLAERVVAMAAEEERDRSGMAAVGARVFERLRARTVDWLGPEAFRALHDRALDRASADHDYLSEARSVLATGDPTPASLRMCLEGRDNEENRRCLVTLVTQFILLLADIIGTDLAILHLRRTWPRLAFLDISDREEEEQS
jgi:hypothetical protein